MIERIPAAILGLSIAAASTAAPPDARGLLVWQVNQLAGLELIEESAEDPELASFLDRLTSSEPWMRDLLDSGRITDGPRTMAFLSSLWNDDPALASRQVDRSMATACALEVGTKGSDETWMKQRYEYFRDYHREELLNSCYDELATWERRFLAQGVQRTSFTTPESMAYLRERICWPRADYVKACWQAPYRSYNCFNDTVQGRLYYLPFRGSFRCDPEMSIEVGGVCGALSNMGAAAAISNGIPALSMGEPGHCAYAVLTAPGQWTPAYTLSWKRGLHSTLSRSNWPSLIISQESMEDEQLRARSGDRRRLARWNREHGSATRAEAAYRKALEINGLDEELWREYLEFGDQEKMTGRWWEQAMRVLQRELLPEHPEPAWAIMKELILPHVLADTTPRERTTLLSRFMEQLDGWGPVRWNIEAAWNWMLTQAGDERQQQQFLLLTLRNFINSKDVGPAYTAWATSKVEGDEKAYRTFEQSLLGLVDSAGEGKDAALRQLARTMLPAAAESGDLSSFQRIGKTAARLYEPRPTLVESGIDPFPGVLLSSGGALKIWQPGNRWDAPEYHWGVLEERGGSFHTQVGDHPWFEIELPHFGELSGIVFEGRNGQTHRSNGARILISGDGDDWEQIATLEGSHVWYRIDLSREKPRGRFIRVERDGKCMHFPRVLVYGRRTS
jgi:hypothetical protein